MLKIIKKYKYMFTFLIILILLFFAILRSEKLKDNNKVYTVNKNSNIVIDNSIVSKNNNDISEEKIQIDIKGQVNNPGVYELENNSRVIDAINAAGGLTDIANTSLINLSKKLEDQMVIIIYSNDEVLNSNVKEIETVFKVIEKECVCPNIKNDSCINTELDNTVTDNSNEDNKLVNINTASMEELMTLPNVGESKAQAIIDYRNENKFTTIEDIMNVSGIGEALFEKIKAHITI